MTTSPTIIEVPTAGVMTLILPSPIPDFLPDDAVPIRESACTVELVTPSVRHTCKNHDVLILRPMTEWER